MRLRRAVAAALAAHALAGPPSPAAARPGDRVAARVPARRLAVALREGAPRDRAEAARRLGRVGAPATAVAALIAALPEARAATVRAAIAEALARRGDPAAAPVLAEELGARPGDAAAPALVHALGAVGGAAAARPLVELARDARLREAAHRALVRLGPGAGPALRAALGDPATERSALAVLAEAPAPATLPALVDRLDHADPELRRLALEGLARLADPRAAPALGARLRGLAQAETAGPPDAEEVIRVLRGLAAVGAAPPPEALARLAGAIGPRPAFLEATYAAELAADPARASGRLAEALAAPEGARRVAAARVAVAARSPAVAPVLLALAREPAFAEAALSALAELDGGAGIDALAGLLGGGAAAPAGSARRELAVALRRWPGHPAAAGARAALRRALAGDPRALPLRALAGDRSAAGAIAAGLDHGASLGRVLAAQAAELLAAPALSDPLRRRLGVERDPEVRAAVLRALAASDPDARPAALARLAVEAAFGPPVPPRAFRAPSRARLRAAARAPRPRARALAAAALAVEGGAPALPTLRALLDDRRPAVRRAAAEALRRVGDPRAAPALAEAARVEPDDAVRGVLADAHRASAAGVPGAPRRGAQVVRFRVRVAGAEARDGGRVRVDVRDAAGDWRRAPTWPGGELVLVELPDAVLDVRPRL